jgi:hypothetical protein
MEIGHWAKSSQKSKVKSQKAKGKRQKSKGKSQKINILLPLLPAPCSPAYFLPFAFVIDN